MRSTCMRLAIIVTLGCAALLFSRESYGQITADSAAALVNYPLIEVDSARGIDTILQLSNTSRTESVYVRCYLENATSHCDNAPLTACTTSNDCLSGGQCTAGWSETDFVIHLTHEQPHGWLASTGVGALPLAGGVVPPVPENPFVGSLRCFVTSSAGDPIDQNVLIGHATIERFVDSVVLDVAKYNAIGMPAITAANNGDGVLELGGVQPEYEGCPSYTVLNHFTEGAPDPVGSGREIFTSLTLLPCSADYVTQSLNTVTVQMLMVNEFEQRFSTSRHVDCFLRTRLSLIDTTQPARSIFAYGVQGTLTAQTQFTPVNGGILAVAIEQHEVPADPQLVKTAALNLHHFGALENSTNIVLREPVGFTCGDGVVELGEQCDDGNTADGDCCSSRCDLDQFGTGCVADPVQCEIGSCDGAGACTATMVVGPCIDDGNACTDTVCHPTQGCVNNPNMAPCDDGLFCTANDTCSGGSCTSGPPRDCSASADQCNDGTCNEAADSCAIPKPLGVVCDADGEDCTLDQCNGFGTCVPDSLAADGSACNDDLFCNGSDTCSGGVCAGHSGDPCLAGAECNNGPCNETADTCATPAGTACADDGRVCTNDACNGVGSCTHSGVVTPQCPSGYSILGSPPTADVEALLTRGAHAGGDVCTTTITARFSSLLEGDGIARATSGTTATLSPLSHVTGNVVTGGGSVVRRPDSIVDGSIDTSGSAAVLSECATASTRAQTRRTALLALPTTQTLPAISVPKLGSQSITLAAGENVIDVPSILVRTTGRLQLVGVPGTTTVIVRVAGLVRLLRDTRIELSGGLTPEQVIFVVTGNVFVRGGVQVAGTVLASGRIDVRRNAVIDGQLIGSDDINVRVDADVNLRPWAGW